MHDCLQQQIMAILSHGQVGVIVLFSVIVTLNALTYCPSGLVSVSANGSLIFQSLSTRSRDNSSNYDPGAIGGWYSLPSGFIDVVRSGSLPYGEKTIMKLCRHIGSPLD